MAFNVLTTPAKDSGLSSLQSACINGDVETVNGILNFSPDKLDGAIAMCIEVGHNSPLFPGKSIPTFLRQQDSENHKQISKLVEKLTKHFWSQSLLHLAARKGNAEHIRRLLDCGDHVDAKSPDLTGDRETPLMLAARFNDVDVVEYLVERGASLDMQDNRGYSVVHYGAMGGKTENTLRLIELGANGWREHNVSPICPAAEYGHIDVIRLLIEHGAHVDKYSVCAAAEKGDLKIIQFLLKNGYNLHTADGWLPLHCAAQGNHTNVVKFIIENGGNVLAKSMHGQTVLHLATRLELVTFLVEKGADINAEDIKGRTPLQAAASNGQVDTVTYLLNHGADINSYDEYGNTPLSGAVSGGHAAAANVLINKGCDLESAPNLIWEAAFSGHTDLLELFLQKGFDVDTMSYHNGETPLAAAARSGNVATVAFLLDRGANINGPDTTTAISENHNGANPDSDSDDDEEDVWMNRMKIQLHSPLYYALEAGQDEVAKLLIERGADTMNPIDGNESLAELAAKHGLSDILELLGGTSNFHFNKVVGVDTLTSAASRGDLKLVRFLLENGVEVNAKDMSGETALTSVLSHSWLALTSRQIFETVELLISFGADISCPNYSFQTPIQLACARNFESVTELLLELGCKQTFNIYCPMYHAVGHDNAKLAEILLQYGADANVRDCNEDSPLHFAARANSLLAAQVLLNHGAELDVVNKLGATPLAEAASRGYQSMVQLLIENGANVDKKGNSAACPLILALQNCKWWPDYRSLVQTLLNHGCSINIPDQYGRSAIYYVPDQARREFFDLLLHHGACFKLSDLNRETALHFAASRSNVAYVEWLLEQGADVGALDIKNRTPLHAAVYGGHQMSVELLIQHGANVNLADSKGWLPLHLAARSGNVNVAEILVENGSDVTAVDKKGRTLLHLASKIGYTEMTEFLIRHGVDINARDYSGQTVIGAMSVCRHSGNWEWNFFQTYLVNGGDIFAVDGITGTTVLHFAAASNLISALDNLLNQGLELEARDKYGDTPLHRAAAHGAIEMIQGLVDRGADLSAVNKKGQTPLLLSLSLPYSEGSKILLESGSSVQVADTYGNTPLHCCVRDPSLVKEIIKKGGDVNAVNSGGFTLLHFAAYHDVPDTARVLLKAGASVYCRDKEGNTPLLSSFLSSSVRQGSQNKTTELLIRYGSDTHATDNQGKTCMHIMMTREKNKRILDYRMIMTYKVQVNAVDELGSTALHLALLYNLQLLAHDLLKHGADPEAVDHKGCTPLHVGCCSGSSEAVFVMIDHGR